MQGMVFDMSKSVDERICEIGIIPVIKLNYPERDAEPLAKALLAGGVKIAEITFRAAGADRAIRIFKDICPEMLVGAGTVLDKSALDSAYQAGAEFVVMPGFDGELVKYAQEKNMAVYPGVCTPSDYQQALKYGLKMLKFYPAEQSGGVCMIKALSAPFPMFKVIPTGGISLKNLADYISCPFVAACGGSYMVTRDLIENGRWDEITELCRTSMQIISEVRRKCQE